MLTNLEKAELAQAAKDIVAKYRAPKGCLPQYRPNWFITEFRVRQLLDAAGAHVQYTERLLEVARRPVNG